MNKPHSTQRFQTFGLDRWIVRRLLAVMGDLSMSVVMPDGSEIRSGDRRPVSRVTIHQRRTLYKLAINPLFEFPEAYISGAIEVEGLESLLNAASNYYEGDERDRTWMDRLRVALRPTHTNSPSGSRENIHHHYDIGNDFYQLWLDRQLVYTCAYFSKPDCSLEEAQSAKMDHVCRKVNLQPGMKVIDAGCGWGALAIHMAKHYGVSVRAFNISHEQINYAREQADRHHVTDRVEFIEDDWRNISGRCDAFVSVGMLEHVGRKNYSKLGKLIRTCLKPDGMGLIHSIGQNAPGPLNPWIERRIFPGAYPPSLKETMDIFEPHGFSVLDVENLRLHYAETLRHWLQRYEDSVEIVRKKFDEKFVRAWRLYLTGSMIAFQCGGLQLFQMVFAHGTNHRIPRTRDHLYPQEAIIGRASDGHQMLPKAYMNRPYTNAESTTDDHASE